MQVVKINDIDIRQTYGISVAKIKGVFDMPGRYGTYEMDWQDVDGIDAFVDSDDLYYKQRKIIIECIMESATLNQLQYNLGLFREQVYGQFTLETPYSLHTCILKEGAKVKFLTSKDEVETIVSFELVCNELSYEFGTTYEPDSSITNNVFWIDNIALSRFGIIVQESEGYLDFPAMKSDKVTRYMRESDKVNTRKTRTISLKCSMIADSMSQFQANMVSFHALLSQPGLRNLMIPMEGIERAYSVFCPNGFKLTDLYQSSNSIVGRFNIDFEETEPLPETFYLVILLDTDGVPILTTDGEYIYVIGDRADTENQEVYLFTPDENEDNIYLYTNEELDPEDEDYDTNSEEIYLFTDSEL